MAWLIYDTHCRQYSVWSESPCILVVKLMRIFFFAVAEIVSMRMSCCHQQEKMDHLIWCMPLGELYFHSFKDGCLVNWPVVGFNDLTLVPVCCLIYNGSWVSPASCLMCTVVHSVRNSDRHEIADTCHNVGNLRGCVWNWTCVLKCNWMWQSG